MIVSKAKHPNCMYMWMNWIISPRCNAAGRGVVRRGAGQPEGVRRRPRTRSHCDTFNAGDKEFFDEVDFWATPTRNCGDDRGNVCVDYSKWVQAWTEIKG